MNRPTTSSEDVEGTAVGGTAVDGGAEGTRSWTFLTNHAHVLLAVAAAPDLRLRDIADRVGITERTAVQIIDDLERDGYVQRERRGRRNRYTIDSELQLRHPLEEHHQVSQLLFALGHE